MPLSVRTIRASMRDVLCFHLSVFTHFEHTGPEAPLHAEPRFTVGRFCLPEDETVRRSAARASHSIGSPSEVICRAFLNPFRMGKRLQDQVPAHVVRT